MTKPDSEQEFTFLVPNSVGGHWLYAFEDEERDILQRSLVHYILYLTNAREEFLKHPTSRRDQKLIEKIAAASELLKRFSD